MVIALMLTPESATSSANPEYEISPEMEWGSGTQKELQSFINTCFRGDISSQTTLYPW